MVGFLFFINMYEDYKKIIKDSVDNVQKIKLKRYLHKHSATFVIETYYLISTEKSSVGNTTKVYTYIGHDDTVEGFGAKGGSPASYGADNIVGTWCIGTMEAILKEPPKKLLQDVLLEWVTQNCKIDMYNNGKVKLIRKCKLQKDS